MNDRGPIIRNASISSYIGAYVERQIRQKGAVRARVHSIFRNGFNLDCGDRLVFVGKSEEGLSAIGLALGSEAFELIRAALSVGDAVRISAFFAQSDKDLGLTLTCYTRPLVTTATLPAIRSVDLSIPHVSAEQLSRSGLSQRLEAAGVRERSGFALPPLSGLYEKFVDTPEGLAEETVRSLIGAGVGLTPSGDDFLQGMILFERITGSGTRLADLTMKLLERRSTTDISMAYYRALLGGYANTAWIELCEAIRSADEARTIEAIRRIQAYGATSGSDSLFGVLTFLKQANWRLLWEKES
ncbi:DUF2877 domain-containing protein [Saccharibacillus sp. CPCC 101409]|uniref:DUF2877 domain-containing protein n=1 Tax=Saccharibacillus sp. CPCC 101409 TaxID=3058041 RepID=UPI002673EF53|nr:DUF2877 domain-containing protein [Saccharibacillus sp. CPCC 101409]MDO3410416.1 DUF2877 domain-containing protein [Saccharibacillus sp. CPCC 101409]